MKHNMNLRELWGDNCWLEIMDVIVIDVADRLYDDGTVCVIQLMLCSHN